MVKRSSTGDSSRLAVSLAIFGCKFEQREIFELGSERMPENISLQSSVPSRRSTELKRKMAGQRTQSPEGHSRGPEVLAKTMATQALLSGGKALENQDLSTGGGARGTGIQHSPGSPACELSRKTRPVADPGTPPSPIFCPEAKSCTVRPPTPGIPMQATGPVAGPGRARQPESLPPPGKSCTVKPRAFVIDGNQMSPATRFLWQVMTYVKASNAVVLQMC
jgi:hypothetical protein